VSDAHQKDQVENYVYHPAPTSSTLSRVMNYDFAVRNLVYR